VSGVRGDSHGGLRSLIVGAHADQVGLVFIGHVCSGFTEADRRRTLMLLRPLERPQPLRGSCSPMTLPLTSAGSKPALVGTVEYREFTPNWRLRHPSWKGFRAGIAPDG
jgi:bifunctional non-homologous end joining protein LigD